jgi:putative transposase
VSFVNTKNRTPSEYICHGLYLYFSGLSLRRISVRLSSLVKRIHVSIWNWIQNYSPQRISSNKKKVLEFIIDEALIKVGSEYIWLWVTIEPNNKEILAISISQERNMFVAERHISNLVPNYGNILFQQMGYIWYLQACKFLKLKHHIHSPRKKILIERAMQCIKDRTEGSMITFHAEERVVN